MNYIVSILLYKSKKKFIFYKLYYKYLQNKSFILEKLYSTRALSHNFLSMITAFEASKLLEEMSPAEIFEAIKKKVGEKTQAALDQKVHEVIAAYERKVELVLGSEICQEPDKDITSFLQACGYVDVKVASDFPGYNESYRGTTTIKFSIPELPKKSWSWDSY